MATPPKLEFLRHFSTASLQIQRADANFPPLHLDHQRGACGRRTRQPQADDSRRHDPAPRRGHLYLDAGRPARGPQDRGHRARGDEPRPRFGVMRGREFVMKDGYSFHADYADLEREYRNMYDTYTRIFTRLGLRFRAVAADTGSIGGTGSHEFQVLAESGEDAIPFFP